jgi:hypothetical protein
MTRLNSLLEINIYLLQFYQIKIKGVINEIIIILNTFLFENVQRLLFIYFKS